MILAVMCNSVTWGNLLQSDRGKLLHCNNMPHVVRTYYLDIYYRGVTSKSA